MSLFLLTKRTKLIDELSVVQISMQSFCQQHMVEMLEFSQVPRLSCNLFEQF